MPTSVVAAIGASLVAQSAAVISVLGTFGAKIAGAIVGAVISSALSRATQKDASPALSQQERTVTVRQAVAPRQIIYGRTRVGGTITHMESTPTGVTRYMHMVITLAGHECDAVEQIYFNDEAVPLDDTGHATGTYAGAAFVDVSLGDEDGQPFPDLVAASGGTWTDAHMQRGCTKLYVRLTYNPNIFPAGIPNITAVVRGKKVYDPRSTLTEWSDNPALVVADYLMDSDYGMGHAYSEIDEDALIAAANICDEAVALAAGGTESRYTANGALSSDIAPREAIGRLLGAMGGSAMYVGGAWWIQAAAYRSPSVTFTEDDFAGPVRVTTRLSRRDSFNAVQGIFTNPADLWQPTDFPPLVSPTYEAEDNGERVWQDIELPFTHSASMAQRIAKIQLKRARQPITVGARLKLSAYRVLPNDTVMLTLTKFGWAAKVFEVLQSDLSVAQDSAGEPVLVVDMILRETAAAVYAWSTDDEQTLDPAPNTTLPDPFVVPPPGAISVVESLYSTRAGTAVKARASIEWQPSPDPYVSVYVVEYRLHGGSEWTVLPSTTGTSIVIEDISPGDYDIRVQARNGLDQSSQYTTTRTLIFGLSAPPSALTGLTIQTAGGLAILQWTQSADQDVLIGGRIDIRHSNSESGGPTWAEATPIGQPLPGAQTIAVVPLKSGTYFVRPYDSSGLAAASATSVSANAATALAYANVDTLTEDPTFSGAHINTIEDGGVLKLDSLGQWDDQADVDAIANVDSIGGVQPSGSYAFATTMDLTTVQRVRLTSRITAVVASITDTIDARGGSVDDWPSYDGDVDGDEAAAWVEYRHTQTDPVGSPTATWSEWERLEQSEAYARAFQFRAQLRTYDPDYNIEVSALSVDADEIT